MIQELKQFAQLLKENGFTVIMPTEKEESSGKESVYNWFKFIEPTNGKFGSVTWSSYDGVTFSRIYKPSKGNGTGVRTSEGYADLTIENAKLATQFPEWFRNSGDEEIKYYKDANDFINHLSNKWCNYYIL